MKALRGVLAGTLLAIGGAAHAVPYHFVDWTAANPGAGTASGTITLPDLSTVTVSFSVTQVTGAAGSFKFAQTSGGTNYWSPSAPYISSQVDNAPPDSDIISLIGGSSTTTYKLTLSEAIKDPIMDIVSLGQPGFNVTYDFDRPFDIVSQGVGFWGGGPTALQELPGDVLQGAEGHGTIQFIGTFDSFSWTAPTSEVGTGFSLAYGPPRNWIPAFRNRPPLPCWRSALPDWPPLVAAGHVKPDHAVPGKPGAVGVHVDDPDSPRPLHDPCIFICARF